MFKIFSISDRCYKGGNQHNFKARYTEKSNPIFEMATKINNACREDIIINEYVYDICTWCGKIIKEK